MLSTDLNEVDDILFTAQHIVAKNYLKELFDALFTFLKAVAVFLLECYEAVFWG